MSWHKTVFDEKVTAEIAARIAKAGPGAMLVFIPKSEDGRSLKFFVGVKSPSVAADAKTDGCDDPPMDESWICPPAPPEFCQ